VTDDSFTSNEWRHEVDCMSDIRNAPDADLFKQELLGQTPSLSHLAGPLSLAAAHHVTVPLTGETGTGKTRLGRLIHEHSPRRGERLMVVPCGALAANLIESELFGHVQGAFTGAERRRVGKFEAVGGGTLLLDEIDALGRKQQAKLLRVIETGEYLELLVEGGVPGLALGLVTAGLVLWLARRASRRPESRSTRALALGALFALVATAAHAVVEFGLHIPAVLLLVTVLAAQVAGLEDPAGSTGAEEEAPPRGEETRGVRTAPVGPGPSARRRDGRPPRRRPVRPGPQGPPGRGVPGRRRTGQ
jgi:hypothetical protein